MIKLEPLKPVFHINLKWKADGNDELHEIGPIPVTEEEYNQIIGGSE